MEMFIDAHWRQLIVSCVVSLSSSTMGKLIVTLIGCRELKGTDTFSKIDPYVKVSIGSKCFKSRVVDNNDNPNYNEEFTFFVADPGRDRLSFKVADKDLFSSEHIGTVEMSLDKLIRGEKFERWLTLTDKTGAVSGTIGFSLTAQDFGLTPGTAAPASQFAAKPPSQPLAQQPQVQQPQQPQSAAQYAPTSPPPAQTQYPQAQYPAGQYPPAQYPPPQYPPAQYPPPQYAPPQYPPSQYPPPQYAPAQYPPPQYPPPQYPPAQYPPAYPPQAYPPQYPNSGYPAYPPQQSRGYPDGSVGGVAFY
jgi:hypothetical protein